MKGDPEIDNGELSKWSKYIYRQSGTADSYLEHNLPERSKHVLKSSLEWSSSIADLGSFQVFPLEVFQNIISYLDLRTLTSLACVSRYAYEVVVSAPEVKVIIEHAHNALAGALVIRTGKWITCELLLRTLCTALCEECGAAGGFLYMLTCTRVCWLCLSSNHLLLPTSYQEAGRRFAIDRRTIGSLPHMRVVPGTYASNRSGLAFPHPLVDTSSALYAGVAKHGSLEAMMRQADAKIQMSDNPNETSFWKADPSPPSSGPRFFPQDPSDGKGSNPFRFVAIVQAPWLNPDTGKPDWGFYCKGCRRRAYKTGGHFRRKFIASTFQEHLDDCAGIKNGEHMWSPSRS